MTNAVRNAVAKMTPRQIEIAFSFIDRASLDRDYRMLSPSMRYQRYLDLIRANIDDPLIAGDIGVIDMLDVTAYFMHKRDEFTAQGK